MTDGERDSVETWPLGARVAAARGGESARSFAKRAGISPELLWQMENGRRRDNAEWARPAPQYVIAVARAAQIDAIEALELAGYREAWRYVDPSAAELAEKLRQLPAETRHALELLIDELMRVRGYLRAETPLRVADEVAESARVRVETRDQLASEDRFRARRSAGKVPPPAEG